MNGEERKEEPIRITSDEVRHAVVPPTKVPRMGIDPYQPDRPPRMSALAVTAFVVGILSIPIFGALTGPVAIIAGALGLAATHSRADLKGFRLAAVGMSLGILSFIGWGVLLYYFAVVKAPEFPTEKAPANLAGERTEQVIDTAPESIRPALQANVYIRGSASGSPAYWHGAGVIVGKAGPTVYVISNRHVANPEGVTRTDMTITFFDGAQAPGRTIWTAPDGVDIAVVETTRADVPAIIPLEKDVPIRTGDDVFAVGNPMNYVGTYTEGAVSSVRIVKFEGRRVK
ncbi:MAG: trypsin-like peptidase domain-containing protein, partial [Planctomycetota bacterium]